MLLMKIHLSVCMPFEEMNVGMGSVDKLGAGKQVDSQTTRITIHNNKLQHLTFFFFGEKGNTLKDNIWFKFLQTRNRDR